MWPATPACPEGSQERQPQTIKPFNGDPQPRHAEALWGSNLKIQTLRDQCVLCRMGQARAGEPAIGHARRSSTRSNNKQRLGEIRNPGMPRLSGAAISKIQTPRGQCVLCRVGQARAGQTSDRPSLAVEHTVPTIKCDFLEQSKVPILST